MEDVIGTEWQLLYSNNPKIECFGVIKDGSVIWQTNNWSLVESAEDLQNASKTATSKVQVGNVMFSRVSSSKDFYIGTAKNDKGHLVVCLVEDDVWLAAWASVDAVPEFVRIDVAKTAINLIGLI